MSDDHGMEWCHLKITRLEAEYAKLWQMYGDVEDDRDRLREVLKEAVAWIEDDRFDDDYISEEWYHMAIKALEAEGE